MLGERLPFAPNLSLLLNKVTVLLLVLGDSHTTPVPCSKTAPGIVYNSILSFENHPLNSFLVWFPLTDDKNQCLSKLLDVKPKVTRSARTRTRISPRWKLKFTLQDAAPLTSGKSGPQHQIFYHGRLSYGQKESFPPHRMEHRTGDSYLRLNLDFHREGLKRVICHFPTYKRRR